MTPRALAWTTFGLGSLAGALAGFGASYDYWQKKLKKEYEEALAVHRRAIENASSFTAEAPVENEAELMTPGTEIKEARLHSVSLDDKPNVFGGTLEVARPESNQYHKALSAVETPVQQFVAGGVNDYGVSYIEEEEYHDDDEGRFKGQIIMVMGEFSEPSFFMNGVKIDDWDTRLGDSIVVDFTQLVPAGVEQVLYVRNHNTDEDYEVIRELP